MVVSSARADVEDDDDSDASHCKMYVEADPRQSTQYTTHLINNNCQNQEPKMSIKIARSARPCNIILGPCKTITISELGRT